MAHVERCLRCGAEMRWLHQTWQCERCRFKLGCCEGQPQSCSEPTKHQLVTGTER